MELTERDYACVGPRTEKVPGSPAWCWQTIDLLKIRWKRKDFTDQQFQEVIDELTAQQVWERVPPEHPYGSLEALLEAEIGCGEKEAKKQLVAQATGSQTHGGRPPKTETANLAVSTQHERAIHNGVSTAHQRKLDYLAGHAPDLLASVQAGSLSTHRAYHLARGTPKETPLDTLHRVWRKVSAEDRLRFLVEMLTPNERRALQLGFEEEPRDA